MAKRIVYSQSDRIFSSTCLGVHGRLGLGGVKFKFVTAIEHGTRENHTYMPQLTRWGTWIPHPPALDHVKFRVERRTQCTNPFWKVGSIPHVQFRVGMDQRVNTSAGYFSISVADP